MLNISQLIASNDRGRTDGSLPLDIQDLNDARVMEILDCCLTLDVRAIRYNCQLTPEAIDASLRRLEKQGSVQRVTTKKPHLWRAL